MLKSDRNELALRKAEALKVIHEQIDSAALRAMRSLIDCCDYEAMDLLVTLDDPIAMHRCQGGIQGLRQLRKALIPPPAIKEGDKPPRPDGGYTS